MFDFFVVSIPEQYWYQKVHLKVIQISSPTLRLVDFLVDLLVDLLVALFVDCL